MSKDILYFSWLLVQIAPYLVVPMNPLPQPLKQKLINSPIIKRGNWKSFIFWIYFIHNVEKSLIVPYQPECFGTRAVLGLEIIFFGLVVHYISFNAPVTALEKSHWTDRCSDYESCLGWIFTQFRSPVYIRKFYCLYQWFVD